MSPFDINTLNLDDTPIEGMEEAFEHWQEARDFPPPPKPGKKSAIIADIREVKQNNGILNIQLDLTLKGGEDDGHALNFTRLSSKMFERGGVRTSQVIDFFKSAGVAQAPQTNKQIGMLLTHMKDAATTVNFQVDWRAYCMDCGNKVLMEQTGELTDEAARNMLVNILMTDPKRGVEIQKTVRKAGEKFRSYKSFPEAPNAQAGPDGFVARQDVVKCPTCGAELRAQANITRWLRPTIEPTPF